MAFVLADRVQETGTVSSGTGPVSLAGAVSGFKTFSSTIGNSNTCYYTIYDSVAFTWEVGIGTYSTSGNQLSRDTVLSSTNSGSLVSFSTSNTLNVWVDYPAEKAVYQGGSPSFTKVTSTGDIELNGTLYINGGSGSTNTNINATSGGHMQMCVYSDTIFVQDNIWSFYNLYNASTVFSVNNYGRITVGEWTATTVAPTYGGTGQTTYTTGDILYSNGTNSLAKLPIGTTGQVLKVVGGVPSWGSASGTGTVTSITAGTGLTGGTITTSGTIALANTAVTSGSYTYGSFTVDAQGRLTAASSGTSPVTSITAGTGLSGGTITSTGTVAISNTGVTAGSYTSANITVNAQGQITAATNGSGGGSSLYLPILEHDGITTANATTLNAQIIPTLGGGYLPVVNRASTTVNVPIY